MSQQGGYRIAGELRAGTSPWPLRWELMVDETCPHEWERVTIPPRTKFAEYEDVVRCALCHVPRCGHSLDTDPCMERRHHQGVHILLSGEFSPLGDIIQ